MGEDEVGVSSLCQAVLGLRGFYVVETREINRILINICEIEDEKRETNNKWEGRRVVVGILGRSLIGVVRCFK